jgi:Cytochrome c oxidase subunit IV
MRTEPRFLLGAGGFAVLVGVVYWFISYEDAGFVMLTFMGLASALIGAYLLYRGARLHRAEDDADAAPGEDSGSIVGRFSSGSIWPLVMGVGTALALQGFIFGAWLVGFGAVLFVWAAVGFMLESRD